MPGIFISYRRTDNPDATGRIYDRLVSEFGKARVFKDVDSIPLGQDFRGHLNEIVGGCAAVLAIIGPKWTDIRNEAGHKRLEDPDDFVRIELEAALARSVPVVPVLVGHAPMPGTSQLPSTLSSLAFRQSIEVRPDPDFHNDATRLVSALRAIIDPNAPHEDMRVLPKHKSPANRWLAWGIAALATLAAVALAIPALKYLRLTSPPETRIAIALPFRDDAASIALSPDGQQIVYLSSGDSQSRLWLRALSSATAQPLPGTEGASAPFWSPDGRSIGFVATGLLKRMDLGGGAPQTLAVLNAGAGSNGVWGTKGDILVAAGPGQSIARVASTGGLVTEVIKSAASETFQIPLRFLPDGNHFLFLIIGGRSDGIYLGALDGKSPVRLTTDIGPATYLPSGWMLWVRFGGMQTPSGPLLAQRLDVRNARLTGAPVSIAGEVSAISATSTGLVAYATTSSAGQRQLTWVDRSGKALGTISEADGTLQSPRVAPDGRRVVVSRMAQGNPDLWLLDGARASRITFNAEEDNHPVWSPDGLRVTFSRGERGGVLLEKLASGAGEEALLEAGAKSAVPSGWSADGRFLLLFDTSTADQDLLILPMAGDRKPFVFLQTPFAEVWGQFSPDRRWVAFASNESGRSEIFVRPFHPPGPAGDAGSNTDATQWMVSTAGGVTPQWSPDGKELYFLSPAGEMMAAPISVVVSAIVPGTPVKLFDAHIWGGGLDNQTGRQYDIAPDGRFLINRVLDSDGPTSITLIQNWNPDRQN
ncbi:MAG: hypothetical protein RL030_2104 [Pseudomonadota bacterium]